jgi:hypothetical protein
MKSRTYEEDEAVEGVYLRDKSGKLLAKTFGDKFLTLKIIFHIDCRCNWRIRWTQKNW